MNKVAIIGSGPCGLSILRSFQQAEEKGEKIPEITCFEKQSDWGGLWNYSWRTGSDQYGDSVHNSMYKYLWSNGPKECLEFADYSFDYHFKKSIPSFPPRAVLHDYILGRAKKANIKKYIKFNTTVINLEPIKNQFKLNSKNKSNDKILTEVFDSVIVASGHFSTPYTPEYKGMNNFQGRILHSHDFRDAEEFRNKNVVIIGSSYSAEDIALQCHKYGAKTLTIAYRNKPMGFKWPEGIKEVHYLDKIEGSKIFFKDGNSQEADAIILCTGYLHYFPFIEESLKLKTHNRLYPPNLYKGVSWKNNKNLFYLGMQDQFHTFNMFDAQAWFVRDLILKKIPFPTSEEVSEDIDKWIAKEENLKDPFQMIDFQTEYILDLCKSTDYPKIDFELIRKNFYNWEHNKESDILNYRNKSFISPVTGTLASIHHTPWLDAMDDSMEAFMNIKK